jgi:hypothetical protein
MPTNPMAATSHPPGEVPEKLTLRLPPDARIALEWMATKRGVTLAEVIRHAISTEKFLIEEIDKGGTVLIEEKGGRVKQLVFG